MKARLLLLALVVLTAALPVTAQTVAVAGIENAGGDPRYDYLAGIVEGLLLFDLSRSPGVTLVNRSRIDDVLEEQRLALSGLTADDERAVEIGRLAGADALIHGSYVFIGNEALFTLTITDVESGTSRAVTDRGSTENAIHRLAEKALAAINGARVSFADPESDRSILSLQDEKPGEIALYSNLIDAEIRLDGEFVGYTTGDLRVPFIIEGVPAGMHTIETDLGPNFGTVELPEVIFRDWSAEVRVRSGDRSVVRADERHFNSILYDLQQLFRINETLYADREPEIDFAKDVSFTDRRGEDISAAIEGRASFTDGRGELRVLYRYGEQEREITLVTGEDEEFEEEIGLTRLRASIESRYGNSCSVTLYLDRTDVYQGLHREEGKQSLP